MSGLEPPSPPPALPDREPLAPHSMDCMGCGPEAAAGYHLRAYPDGQDVIAEYTFTAQHTGAPGLAHGGAVAALCDDLIGYLLVLHRFQGVTRVLEVEYHKPVLLGEPHHLRATLESLEGRKLWARCEAHAPDGALRFSARALFLRVGIEHFLEGMPADERARAEAWIAEQRAQGEEIIAW